MRWIGAGMLIVAGWMAGEHFCGQFDRKLAEFRSMQRAVHKLEAGFRTHQEFPRMLQGLDITGNLGQKLSLAGQEIEQGAVPDKNFWNEVFECWPEEDKGQFSLWFAQLALGDRTLREAQLVELQQYISERIEALQQEKISCSRLYRNLGVLLGTAAAIMVL